MEHVAPELRDGAESDKEPPDGSRELHQRTRAAAIEPEQAIRFK